MPQSYLDSQSTYVDKDAMIGLRKITPATDATLTFTPEDSGLIYVATKSSATQTFTFPKASTCPGMTVTLICGHASGEINTAVDAADSVVGLTFAAIGADADTAQLSTTAGHGVKNTAATNVVGDQITVVSDGVATWYILGIATGIWAAL